MARRKKRSAERAVPMRSADLPADDFKNYALAVGAVQRALAEAISMLKTKADRAVDLDEGNRIAEAAGDLQDQLQEINRELTVFLAGTGQVIPPSEADVKQLQKIADDLDRMIATQQAVQAIIKAAANVIDIWKSTRPK